MNITKPRKSSEILAGLICELEILYDDAQKFDKGNDSAGLRLRKRLYALKARIEMFRKEIQRTRYYREAWDVYYKRKKYIDGLEHKEKKYGSISEVVKVQILQKWRA